MTAHDLLVVEDDPERRRLLVRGLSEGGFQVNAVSDGAEALVRTDETVDGLVVDVGLPDADGRTSATPCAPSSPSPA